MSIIFGTSVFGPQVLVDELERSSNQIVIGIDENSDEFPRRVGYGYVFARDFTANSRYLFWRSPLYIPGHIIAIPPADGNLFAAIRVVAFWDVPDLNFFIAV